MDGLSALRRQFPILTHQIGSHPLVYLDSAATAQKPRAVSDAMTRFYEEENGNAHRGMHALAERATVALERARGTVQRFLGAAAPEEIVFTRNATEAINLVTISLSRGGMFADRNGIVLTELEHHSNIVPWQQLKERKNVEIDWAEIGDDGALAMDSLKRLLAAGAVKVVSVTGLSNVLGTRPPLDEIVDAAHEAGALVLVDAAQLAAHATVDVRAINCDFLVVSGHKLFGPSGVGALYAKADLLRSMPPFLGGGGMVQRVTKDGFVPADIPQKFEAGTQPIADAVGLAAAIDWMGTLDRRETHAHERRLLARAIDGLRSIPGIRILGPGDAKKIDGCVSFVADGVHSHDLTEVLGRRGVCLRAGNHCAQPLHARLGVTDSTRLSVAPYNTEEEIDLALTEIEAALKRLRS